MLKIRCNFREYLFVLALATKPLYLRNSGALQISDLLYMLLLGTFLISGKIRVPGEKEKKWFLLFLLMITYQLIVNTAWFFALSSRENLVDPGMLRVTIYYIFNFLVCLTIMQMYAYVGYNKLLRLYLLGSAISVIICYLGVMINFTGTGREHGFFNNPNQLGYFSIIIMTAFVINCRHVKKVIRIAILVSCMILVVFSLSKASIIGSAVLLIAYAIISSDERGIKKTVTIIALISIAALIIYFVMYSKANMITNNYYIMAMRRRLTRMQFENDSDLGTGRGYDRIKEIGGWILTGVGEGAYTRFSALYGKELHSMYASSIVCYGLFGFVGYMLLFYRALNRNNRIIFSLLAFSGVLFYCITHNGVRNTLLWSLIAMMLLRSYEEESVKEGI